MMKYTPAKYKRLPVTSFSPGGWLKRELQLQAASPAGRLDVAEEFGERYPVICDNQWLGGKHEMDDEPNTVYQDAFPMWFQGFVNLALLTGDESLNRRLDAMVDKLIACQCPDGWTGPVGTWSHCRWESVPCSCRSPR